MTDAVVPPIPLSLQRFPSVGGLVLRWITPTRPTARGGQSRAPPPQAFASGLPRRARTRMPCATLKVLLSRRHGPRLAQPVVGVCGRPLEHRSVLMMRLSDLSRQCTSEPALHPSCAAYTRKSCPMTGGGLDHYRSSLPRLDTNTLSAPDAAARHSRVS